MLADKIRKNFRSCGIELSKDFDDLYKKNGNCHQLKTKEQCIGIFKVCMYWKKFICDADFPNLVMEQILLFDRIGCCVIGSTQQQDSYVGNFAHVKSVLPPHCITQYGREGRPSIIRGYESLREPL